MSNSTEQKKVQPTRYDLPGLNGIKLNEANGFVGYVEGFVQRVQTRIAQTKKGEMRVTDVSMRVNMTDYDVEHYFGKELVNPEYHNVMFEITFWGRAAEHIVSYPPNKKQKVLCAVRNLKINSYKDRNGNTQYTIQATGGNKLDWTSKRDADGECALVQDSNQNQSKPAEKQPAYNVSQPANNGGFVSLDDDDEDLPF